jgi:hypothetical protein
MALAISCPCKHPKIGVYWLRRAVPADLRALAGKREEKQTLGTKTPRKQSASTPRRWPIWRRGGATSGLVQRSSRSRTLTSLLRSFMTGGPTCTAPIRAKVPGVPISSILNALKSDSDNWRVRNHEKWCEKNADEILQRRGLVVDETGRRRMARLWRQQSSAQALYWLALVGVSSKRPF